MSGQMEGRTMPCSENCNCSLTRALVQLKNKIAEQSKVLNGFEASKEEPRCNVELTASEEKLFGLGTVKEDSMVCCVLVRELRAQKRDLEDMMARWVEFADKADRFALVTTEIRDKLAVLAPRIESILHETKVLEVIELENEETRRREIDEELRRSSERREIFRETVDRFIEAETRHHQENLARREKLDALEREGTMDRGALKLGLARMMKAMDPRTDSESKKKTETSGGTSIRKPSSKITETLALRPPDAHQGLGDNQISLPGQSGIHDNLTREKINSPQRPGPICPGKFCDRTIARRPF